MTRPYDWEDATAALIRIAESLEALQLDTTELSEATGRVASAIEDLSYFLESRGVPALCRAIGKIDNITVHLPERSRS